MNIVIPVERIAAKLKQPGHSGLVCLVGVQSNQFPRAMAIARRFRAQGIAVAIGGFHVSGCISMLKELTPELQEALDLGITLFAGEAEEQFESFLQDHHRGAAKPLYNYMKDLPNLQNQTIPYLPRKLVQRYDGVLSSFDAGRGCPFQCSFCTIINVQGRKSRWRDADDIERIVRENAAQGFPASSSPTTISPATRTGSRSSTADRIARRAGLRPPLPHPGRRAGAQDPELHREGGARRVPLRVHRAGEHQPEKPGSHEEEPEPDHRVPHHVPGLEEAGIVTYAGFIMGCRRHAADHPPRHRDHPEGAAGRPARIHHADAAARLGGPPEMLEKGVWMDPDLNKYDLETVTVEHPRMSREEWQQTYQDMWSWYYTDEHVERMMRRNVAYGIKPVRIVRSVLQIYGAANFEHVHPQQCGYFRRKDRTQRRPELPREPAVLFYPRHVWQTMFKYARFAAYGLKLHRMRMRIQKDPAAKAYADLAITPVVEAETEALAMFDLNESSRAAVKKARQQAHDRREREEAALGQTPSCPAVVRSL
jgi:hypothetical protein